MNCKPKPKKAFTLIELLVVIAIIAILVVLIIMALNAARQRARDSKRRTDLRSVQTGLELYNDTSGSYPQVATYTLLKGQLENANQDYGFDVGDMPDDPLNTGTHVYGYNNGNSGIDYALGVRELEGAAGTNDTVCGVIWEHCVGTDMDIVPAN